MDIVGKSDRAVDRVNADESLAVADFMKLSHRLSQTVEGEQFFFRELELDCVFRQADMEYTRAVRSGKADEIAFAATVRSLVFQAHDLVGIRELGKAIETLHTLMDVLVGVQGSGEIVTAAQSEHDRPSGF
jgi:hypothetical protein